MEISEHIAYVVTCEYITYERKLSIKFSYECILLIAT